PSVQKSTETPSLTIPSQQVGICLRLGCTPTRPGINPTGVVLFFGEADFFSTPPINRYQKRCKRKSLMQLCKKNVYNLWRESEILLIFAYTTLF
ncbi:MAG: hypothetical protein KIG57_07510, partial [Muribaculaceae bacterium]|nr:hypothetical protein [Muribaculaceae bacterium]